MPFTELLILLLLFFLRKKLELLLRLRLRQPLRQPHPLSPLQVYEILAKTAYGKRRRAEVGVARLLAEGAYAAAFPLHEVRESSAGLHFSPHSMDICMSQYFLFQFIAPQPSL